MTASIQKTEAVILRKEILPLIEVHPVVLIAAFTRSGDVCFRIAKDDDGVRHDGLRQAEQLLLGFYPVHLGPGAQPDCTKPKLLRGKADVLGRDCTVNDQ